MALIANGISITLGGREILSDAALTAQAGCVTAIVGPNGSGKTTLLRCLTGDLPCRGSIQMNGQDCMAMNEADLAVRRAVLPQAAGLAFPFTVLEVVRLGLTAGLAGLDRIDPDALARRSLERVGLSGFAGRFFHDLSGGEKQRVQLARVLVQIWTPVMDGAPRWLFLDEPVSALDIGHQLLVMGIARDYADQGGGVITVLHDLNLTAMFSDHVLLLQDGRVLSAGAPEHVLTTQNLMTAYECPIRVGLAPQAGPWVLPQSAAEAHGGF
ncbi:heme ABC transporter ATP-binding protein [Roseovarius aestuarii]|nr:heme ABC transporter ATP-binding protein [Roseovarius aestuarii]